MLLPKSKHHSSFLKVILCRSKEFSQSADGELRTMKVDLLQSLHFTDRKNTMKVIASDKMWPFLARRILSTP